MSNKESLIPTSNLPGNQRKLPVRDIYSAFYISQVQNSDNQLYLFFFSLFSLAAQGIAFFAITELAKQTQQREQFHTHATPIVAIAQSIFALLFLARLVKVIQTQQLVHAHAITDYSNTHMWLIRHLPTMFEVLNGASILGVGIFVLGTAIYLDYLLTYYVVLFVIIEIPAQMYNMAAFLHEEVENKMEFVLNFSNSKDAERGWRWFNYLLPIAVAVAVQWRNFAHAKE
jgi:hypothetical protein